MQALRIEDRLQATALLDRILYGDAATFAGEDAAVLRRLLPPLKTPWVRLAFFARHRDASSRGHAAGVGDVELPGETRTTEYASAPEPFWRCGQYKVTPVSGGLEIWKMMEFDDDAPGARLRYHADGSASVLEVYDPRQVTLSIPFTVISIGLELSRWRPWKHPV